MIRVTAEKKNVSFEVINRNYDLHSYIWIDPMRFEQIFVNLLSNAVKFTPTGGQVTFALETIKQEKNTLYNRFTIQDTGVGMSKEFIENELYLPFSQEYNGLHSSETGSGLGLSIVKSLIEQMGGKINVKSAKGTGTTFVVEIELKVVEKPENLIGDEKKNELTDIMSSLKEKRILMCEDHPLNSQIAKRLLERAECMVDIAENGEKGIEMFIRSPLYCYDAILMDIRMPIMDGLTATRRIRALSREDAKKVPIIAMTANAYDEDIRNTREAGMNAHLSKPIEPIKLYKTLYEQILT